MCPAILSLVLAMAQAPTSVCHTLEAAADRADPAERGRALAAAADVCREGFEAVSVDAPDAFVQRSYFAFEAHRIYLKAHKAGGADRPLCTDRRMLEAFAASLATLELGERQRDRADVQATLKHIATLQTCDPEPTPAPPGDEGGAPTATPADSPRPMVKPQPSPPASELAPPPRPQPAPVVRSRRPLRIASAATFGVGLGLVLGMVAPLVRGAGLRQHVTALNSTYMGNIPADQAVDPEDGKRADRLAVGLGIPGVAGMLAGIALLAVDTHRARTSRRFSVRPFVLPASGVRFTMEF